MNPLLDIIGTVIASALGGFAAVRLWEWRISKRQKECDKLMRDLDSPRWRLRGKPEDYMGEWPRDTEAAADKYARYLR